METARISETALPSKWDIIPIHASDISAYKRCRRYWDWSSPTRTGLRRKVQIFGVNPALWFGTGIHYALEMYYNPVLKRDPVEAWLTFFDLSWRGGIVDADWLDRVYDIDPETHGGTLYKIRGLMDLLPDPDQEEFMAYKELGVGMMEFYKDYAKRNDDFQVVAAESMFSVPLGFEAVDRREDSPNYGEARPVHARGKRDAIIQSLETGRFGIIDHKTKSKIDDNYRASLQKDEQCTNYMCMSQEEAEVYDLPYKEISFVVHQALRKVFPSPPTPLKSGLPSLSRTDESTTPAMFEQYVKENNLRVWFESNEKAQFYYEYLVKEGDRQFIERNHVWRNAAELNAQGRHIRAIAKEMLSDPAIYPHPTGDFLCINCAFRAPCLAADDGSDWIGILEDGYERQTDR